jgi:hypothetical protein
MCPTVPARRTNNQEAGASALTLLVVACAHSRRRCDRAGDRRRIPGADIGTGIDFPTPFVAMPLQGPRDP